MAERVRDYLFYDVALSVCPHCHIKIEGKILFVDGRVVLRKRCPQHGSMDVLVADDVEYYRRAREVFLKPSEMPVKFNTPVRWGCPYDCGLCKDHEQHSCLSLVEITDHCNLACPICYAESGPHRPGFRPLAQVESMLDAVVANEGEPDVVQISGGEPTLHPQFFEILDAARARPIRHLMVNTNGLRIAKDAEFVRRLAEYRQGFEIYLQFDSFRRDTLMHMRGADLREVHERALDRLDEHGISTTLVVTLEKGRNDAEIGDILRYALARPCIRGVTFQPVQEAGRLENFDHGRDRLTLTEVRRGILEQCDVFRPEDIIPVPCHPDSLAMGYALKIDGQVLPLTGAVEPEVLINGGRNTIVVERDESLRDRVFSLFSTGHGPEGASERLRDLLCCLPRVDLADDLGYENVFRVLIVEFQDAWSLDVRSVRKSCIHIVHPEDGRLIPFDTYNLFYRDGLERERLEPLRQMQQTRRLPVMT